MHYIFSLIQRYILSRAGSTVIGLFVVISLIWFAGPVVGLVSVVYRLTVIGAILIIFLVIWGLRTTIAARRGARLQNEISGQDDSKASSRKLEIQLLKEKMNEAISSLKSSDLGVKYSGNAALYALPWYMIIGPSAAGKSTLLRKSGLHFSYERNDDIHVKGYGGTRNCDWWFSDQAVFLDTAGRYTTEDDDQQEWISFLGMLYKHRKKMPINGVIVAVNLAEILTTDKKGLEWHVKIIRNRISELIQHLGLVFPIYLVFTKSDLLHGFEAFYEDLSDDERNQVWGAYLYDKYDTDENPSVVFEGNLNGLYSRLCNMRLSKVSMQRNLKRKSEIFDFPNQFLAAAERLNKFITLLFKENPYQETPQFAGVYFTSATQEGTQIERVIGNLRQAFGISKKQEITESASQKPYFIKNLFSEVIFQIQGGARASRKKQNWNRGLRTVAVVFSLAVIGGAYLLISGSYATNTYLLNSGVSLANTLSQVVTSEKSTIKDQYVAVVALYKHLERLRAIDNDIPWINQVALYRANEQSVMIGNLIYESLLKAYWIPSVNEITNRLSNLSKRWEASTITAREELRPKFYEMLKLYLQLTTPERFEYDAILIATTDVWKDLVFEGGESPEEDLKYLSLLARLFMEKHNENQKIQLTADASLITEVRQQLHSAPDPSDLYKLLLSKGSAIWNEQSLKTYITGEGKDYLISKRGVPGIYTADAWYKYVKNEISSMAETFAHGDWVMGDAVVQVTHSEKLNILDSSNTLKGKNQTADIPHNENAGKNLTNSILESAEINNAAGEYTDVVTKQANKAPMLAENLKHEVRALYFKDYAKTWKRFLSSLRYKLPDKMSDKSRALMYLSSFEGPIAQLSSVIAYNTLVFETKPVPQLKDVTANIDNENVENETLNVHPVKELAEVFSDLQRFSVPDEEGPVSKSVKTYLEALDGVYREVDDLVASVDIKRNSERFAANLLSGQSSKPGISKAWTVTMTLINSVEKQTKPILKSLLSPPVQMAWYGVLGQATSELEQEWRSSVVKPYMKQISGKFPFSLSGDDAALADVAEFYRPDDGILWKFANERLSPYLRKTSKGWQPRRWQGVGANFSSEFLKRLAEAQKITDALYIHKHADPKMTFYLQPDPSPGLREMQIESNGQLYRYRNGPQVWQRFDWPGDMRQIGARVLAIADHGRAVGELRADGPWGLFHLLTQADITKVGGTYYKTSWNLPASDGGTVSVAFKLRADREDNVFNFKLINSFRLPSSLFNSGKTGKLAAY